MTPRTLTIAVRYRADSPWRTQLFPDDLPEEWRPVYLGNELRCVLTDSGFLAASDEDTLDSWSEAMDAGLCVLIDDDGAPPSVLSAHTFPRIHWDARPRMRDAVATGTCSTADDNDRRRRIALIKVDASPAPAQSRAWIETALEIDPDASIVLAFDGAAGFDAARQAVTVATFMGW